MTEHHHTSLLKRMGESGVDALLLTHLPNIRYLTGYSGDGAFAVVNHSGITVFVYRINRELAEETVRPPSRIVVMESSVFKHFETLDRSFWGSTVGYEPDSMRCSTYQKICAVLKDSKLKPVSGSVEALRVCKNDREQEAIERAQKITDDVFEDVLGLLHEGVSERDIAAEVDYRFRVAGGAGPSFETIVAFGVHASMPHAIPDGRKLNNGDIVLFDMGTFVDGYASDMTRTVVFGKASRELKDRYRLVSDAQMAGIEAVRDGADCSQAHHIAWSFFDDAGLGEYFIHSLGHGIGVEVHEAPTISPRSTETFERNTVVTIEPGIYLPGWGGIRIEDIVFVTGDGNRVITASSKELIEL